MKFHELKIKHCYLVDIARGIKTFELRKNDRDYQVGDLIRFIDERGADGIMLVSSDCKVKMVDYQVNENTLFRIVYVLKNVEEYGLNKDYCILGIKRLKCEEV